MRCTCPVALLLFAATSACTLPQLISRSQPLDVEYSTLRPTLCWETFPSEGVLKHDAQGLLATATDVRYELRIYDERGDVRYAQTDLTTNEHCVSFDLTPDETYHWTVRPRFRIDGQARAGNWCLRASMEFVAAPEGAALAARYGTLDRPQRATWTYRADGFRRSLPITRNRLATFRVGASRDP